MLRKPRIKHSMEAAAAMPGDTIAPDAAPRVSTEYFRQKYSDSPDIVLGGVTTGGGQQLTLVFVDGLVSTQVIDDYVLKPLMQESAVAAAVTHQALFDLILGGSVYHNQKKRCDTVEDCNAELLYGSVLLVSDEQSAAVAFEVKGFDKRGISEPSNENVLKGSKEAFVEVLRVNTSLVRRRIQSPELVIRQTLVGRRSRTAVSVVYLDGIANPRIVDAVMERLQKIDIDGISTVGQIETFLLEHRRSLFPQILYTERADKFCGNILEGRVGIMIDGQPTAYITPVDVTAFLQAPEDYAQSAVVGTLLRILRYCCVAAALILPAFYVAITTFHQEMIPTKLALSIISSKQGVPFPTYLEVLMMLLAFEVLQEAGLRLPQAIGQAVSIVGGLVVGQAAITAGILSPGVVIVISATGICGFVIPSQDFANTIRILRAALVLLTMLGGLHTVTLGLIVILYRMSELEVFGVPYLSPFAGTDGEGMFRDTVVMQPWDKAKLRPVNISPVNKRRQGDA